MEVKVISINDFESKVKGWVPHSSTGRNPMQWYMAPFECGCGKTHNYNNVYTPIVMDNNNPVAIFSPGCQYLIAIKFKGFFKFTIKTLFACKLEINEEDYGLQERKVSNEIKTLISRFKDDWKEGFLDIPPINW
jgi:hypothetical protein